MNQHNYERGNRILDESGDWKQTLPYGHFSGHISPNGFRVTPEPKPIWRKLAEPEYLLYPEISGWRKVTY